jgi:hypothetical protein
MKAAFDSMAEKEKRDIEQREAEKRSREEASTFLRGKSGNDSVVPMPRGKGGVVEATSTTPVKGFSDAKGISDEERSAAAGTIHTLESQVRELSETVAKLRRDLRV